MLLMVRILLIYRLDFVDFVVVVVVNELLMNDFNNTKLFSVELSDQLST